MNVLKTDQTWLAALAWRAYSLLGALLIASFLLVSVALQAKAEPEPPIDLTELGRSEGTQASPSRTGIGRLDAPANMVSDRSSDAGQTQTQQASGETTTKRVTPQVSVTTGRVGKRKTSRVGLASIGLNQGSLPGSPINSLIWSQSDAAQVLALLKATPARGSSAALSTLTTAITVQTAVPPKNAGSLAEQLVMARLDWLARSGQSDKLSRIVRLLPLEEQWADWKRWQIEYDLVRRSDEAACRDAEHYALQTLEPFWHKARAICALLDGQRGAASFAADILRDSGEQDENFFQLVDKLLGRSTELSIDPQNLSLLHLILLDAAHEEISLAAFENLPPSMIQAASSFRYLAPDAALSTSYQLLERGLQNPGETEQIWRALMSTPVSVEAALASLDGLPADDNAVLRQDGLDSAFLWVGLATRQGADTDMLIGRALRHEAAIGRMDVLLALYASLIKQRLQNTKADADADTDSDAETLSAQLLSDYAVVLALAAPERPLPPAVLPSSTKAKDIQAVLRYAADMQWDADQLMRLDCWALLPVFEAIGMTSPQLDWVARLTQTDNDSVSESPVRFRRLPQPSLLALEQAAAAGRIGEAGLIAAQLIQPFNLGWIAPQDSARVIVALQQAGLAEVANILAQELVRGYLLRQHFALSES